MPHASPRAVCGTPGLAWPTLAYPGPPPTIPWPMSPSWHGACLQLTHIAPWRACQAHPCPSRWHVMCLPACTCVGRACGAVYVASRYRKHGVFADARCTLAIHNLAHQGAHPPACFDSLGVPSEWYGTLDWVDEVSRDKTMNVLKVRACLLRAHAAWLAHAHARGCAAGSRGACACTCERTHTCSCDGPAAPARGYTAPSVIQSCHDAMLCTPASCLAI